MEKRDPALPDYDPVANAWDKWESWLEPCYRGLNQRLLERAGVREGHSVLDLGCGSGEPAIQESQKVGRNGKVIGLDISNEMLAIARGKAKVLGLTNVEFHNHEVDTIPFAEHSFDSVTARFSFMFLKSAENTLREVQRVLKPGGELSACVWGSPDKNPLPRNIVKKYSDVPDENPEVPGPYRFARSGVLVQSMQKAGFVETLEEEVPIQEIFNSGRQYVDHLLESSVVWGALLRKLQPVEFQEAVERLIQAAEEFRKGDHIEIPRCALLVSGKKT